MAFREAVLRKFCTGIKGFYGGFFVHAVGRGPLHEAHTLRVHFRFNFLAHGAAQKIGFSGCIARQHARHLLHMFLVGDHTESFAQHRL